MTGLIHEPASLLTALTDKPVNQTTLTDWLEQFAHGRLLVADKAHTQPAPVTYYQALMETRTGQPKPAIAAYDEDEQEIAVSLAHFPDLLDWHEQRHDQPTRLITSANLEPLNVYFPIGATPFVIGTEEQAHDVFHQKVKPKMGDRAQTTHLYDGSDTCELHATRTQLTLGINGNLDFYNNQGFPVPPDELRNIRRGIKLAHRVQD
jgi:hypothetical protein